MSIKIEHVSHLYGEGEAFEKKALDDVTLDGRTVFNWTYRLGKSIPERSFKATSGTFLEVYI